MSRWLIEKVCGELQHLPDSELRQVLEVVARYRKGRSEGQRGAKTRSSSVNPSPKQSFRNLRAFGMWRNRSDLTDPILFAVSLRRLMERGQDGKLVPSGGDYGLGGLLAWPHRGSRLPRCGEVARPIIVLCSHCRRVDCRRARQERATDGSAIARPPGH